MKKWMFRSFILVLGVMQVQGAIVHRYGMDDPNDSVGTANATLVNGTGNSIFADGQLTLAGGGTSGAAGTDYLNLPNGIISALGTQATFEVWTTWTSGGMWCRIFDLGASDCGEDLSCSSGNSRYIFLSPYGGASLLRCGINMPIPSRVENVVDGPALLTANEQQHVVITYDEGAGLFRMYLNGAQVAQNTIPAGFTLAAMNDFNNWLGRSQWPDPMYGGKFNEFRIYNHAMTAAEVEASLVAGTEVSIATQVSPTNLATGISATPTLTWAAGYMPADATGKAFRLYLSKIQADVVNAAPAAMVADVTTTSYTVPAGTPLAKDSTYYWRVDEKLTFAGNTDPNFIAGAVQSFETEKTVPVLTTSAPFVVVGSDCSLTVNIAS
ncbi:MAG: LamG domain-containing protein, partial [Phycisphaerae bacterium]|nr:LamG domain-containing protein [Phycisphaerae bacterium]